jgi:hypothetical protein
MSKIEDQILAASGGLNYDDDPRLFEGGDTDYRLNMIPTALGTEYVLTNLKGTTKKSHGFSHDAAYSAAVYITIGSCYDVKRNAIYYFIYSDLTNHCILRYNIDDDDFDKIAWDNLNLGFSTSYPIVDAYMIDDWLYWNPRNSSPRSINVEWAYYNYVATPIVGGVGTRSVGDIVSFRSKVYEVVAEISNESVPIGQYASYFDFIGWSYDEDTFASFDRYYFNTVMSPRGKIGVDFLNDSTVKYNKVWGKVFQFTYMIYTPELGLSTSAPFTDVIVDFAGEKEDGDYTGDVTRNNRIRIKVPFEQIEDDSDGSEDWLFERVDVLFREAGS